MKQEVTYTLRVNLVGDTVEERERARGDYPPLAICGRCLNIYAKHHEFQPCFPDTQPVVESE